MGDSRISYTIIFKDDSSSMERIKKSFSLSADSTLSEVISQINSNILPRIDNFSFQSNHNGKEREDGNDGNDGNDDDATKSNVKLNLYDCTTYPPKEITSLVNQYTSSIGPKSITLQRLNWFPSAKLFICQADDQHTISSILTSNVHLLDEFEYNNPEIRKEAMAGQEGGHQKQQQQQQGQSLDPNKDNQKVQLTGDLGTAVKKTVGSSTKLLPSDVFKAVENRFDINDGDNNNNNDDNKVTAAMVKQQRRKKEENRRKLLDMRLEQLESKSAKKSSGSNSNNNKTAKKKKKVSDQVKKMLIKSRSEGNKKIRVEDRFYLDTVLLDETKVDVNDNDDSNGDSLLGDESKNVEQFMSSSYMFFSRVATVGKVVSTRVGSLASSRDKGAELLVLTSVDSTDSMVYRRLPPTLPLHEAESKGYFKNFGRVIVRIFKADVGSVSSCYTESIIDS
jgi:hypothetical protein